MRWFQGMLIAVCLLAAGCTQSGKKSSINPTSRNKNADNDRTRPNWWGGSSDRNERSDSDSTFAPTGDSSSSTSSEAILAGRLVNASGTRVRSGFIKVIPVENGTQPASSKEIGVEADGDGIFMIRGLQSGKTYMLSARVDDGNRVLAGVVQVRPPNARVVIRVSEDNVSSLTPEAPTHPGNVGPFAPPEKKPKNNEPANSIPPPEPVQGDDPLTPSTPSTRQGPPPLKQGPNPPPMRSPQNNSNVDPSNIAEDPSRNRNQPPIANIPNPNGSYTPPPVKYPSPPKPVTTPDSTLGPPPKKSSANPVKRDFTVFALNGDTWEFRNASGRLVLVDFWFTTCPACIQGMPHLKKLAKDYGSSGLEIIGVACEQSGKDFQKQVKDIERVSFKQQLNYSVYIDQKGAKSAQSQFQVSRFPTMFLLDRQGNILWSGVGNTANSRVELEEAIRKGLSRP